MNLHVDSEVGRLRQVILHKPDLELKRLTPTNHDEYLFDDVLWVKRAKQEHDAFAGTLRDLGVEVHHARPAAARDGGGAGGPQVHPRGGSRRARLRSDGDGQPAPRLRRHGRHRADPLPHRRHDQARAARAHRRTVLGRRAGPRARRRAPAPVAQPHVHPGHVRVDLRRGVDQRHAQAGQDPGDHPLRGDLSLAPVLRRRGVQRLVRGHGQRAGHHRGR